MQLQFMKEMQWVENVSELLGIGELKHLEMLKNFHWENS